MNKLLIILFLLITVNTQASVEEIKQTPLDSDANVTIVADSNFSDTETVDSEAINKRLKAVQMKIKELRCISQSQVYDIIQNQCI